jgi:hypothetical protein
MGLLINYKKFGNPSDTSLSSKQRIFNSNVKSVLLYGCET